ncbi:IS4 family transposase [Selenomonas ruminantium]|nr:IS4 family transposase [Selenomonas ruminantium]
MGKVSYKNPKEADKKVRQIRDTLNGVISEMAKNASSFVVNPEKDFTRKRTLTFERMLKIILGMGGQSLNKELADYFMGADDFATKSAFVQQRDKIHPEAFKYLLHKSNELSSDEKTYMGYRLYACDGTVVNVATNPENKETHVNSYRHPEGLNQYHVNTLFDLMNKTYTDAVIQGVRVVDELQAAVSMINNLPLKGKAIFIGDRGYAAINLMEHCRRKDGMEFLIRVKEGWNTEVKALPMEEFDVDVPLDIRTTQTKEDKVAFKNGTAKYISGKSKFGKNKVSQTWDFESKHKMSIRVVRFKITEDKYETIATSLDRGSFPADKIKELYNMRWGIETSFRDLKYAIGMVNFHARKDNAIIQEIFASLVMYNFSERITACVVIVCATPRVYEYQVNFAVSAHICRSYYRKQENAPPTILQEIAKYIEPVRQGRADKRKLKAQTVVNFIYRVA